MELRKVSPEFPRVAAGMVKAAGDYPWSSAQAHLDGRDDRLVRVEPLLEMVSDWGAFLEEPLPEAEREAFRTHERTGRPLGSEAFAEKLEIMLGRPLRKRKPGPKPGVPVEMKQRGIT